MISSSIKHGFGFDIDHEWLYAECGVASTFNATYRPTGSVIIPPQEGILESFPKESVPTCIRETQLTGSVGETFHGGVKSGLFLAGYVVGGKNEQDVENNILNVASWFENQSKWKRSEQCLSLS